MVREENRPSSSDLVHSLSASTAPPKGSVVGQGTTRDGRGLVLRGVGAWWHKDQDSHYPTPYLGDF